MSVTYAQLRERVMLDVLTDTLLWLPRPLDDPSFKRPHLAIMWNTRFAWKPVSLVRHKRKGYLHFKLTLASRTHKVAAHRAILMLHLQRDLIGQADHRNRVRDDNSVDNLRDVSDMENRHNRSPKAGKIDDLPLGVYRRGKRFRAQFTRDGVQNWLGTFATVEDAEDARKRAEAAHNNGVLK